MLVLCWEPLGLLLSLLHSASGLWQHRSTEPALGHSLPPHAWVSQCIWYSSALSSKSNLIFQDSCEWALSYYSPGSLPLIPHILPKNPADLHLNIGDFQIKSLALILLSKGLLNTSLRKSLQQLNAACAPLPHITFFLGMCPSPCIFCWWFPHSQCFPAILEIPLMPHAQWVASSFWVYLWTP